jgi:hypothetical protein
MFCNLFVESVYMYRTDFAKIPKNEHPEIRTAMRAKNGESFKFTE